MLKKIRTLLLNANYQPRAVIPVERAFALWFEDEKLGAGIGKIDIVLTAAEVHSGEIPEQSRFWRSPSSSFPVPLVVALRKMRSPLFDLNNTSVGTPNLRGLMKRDRNRCLYCLREEHEFESGNYFTMDHIVPRYRFRNPADAHHYQNLALSCLSCNLKKGGRTPEEAGMTLHGIPLEPTRQELVAHDLLECQKVFVTWCREGGPVPEGLGAAA
ncbi:MAG: HNH endonuclease [Gemmatimonadota bacterium]|jgi:5-methylcytosine-specific restriction endonuclease McrA|nr:HNH endonuclease [Gemmatimonadota bacterium]